MTQTLKAQFDDLHAQRVREWGAAALQRNIDQRCKLVAAFDPRAIAQPGDRLPDLPLEGADGEPTTLYQQLEAGPLLLIFFRFAGCPACNIALPHYDATLRSLLAERGVQLAAISPHLPEQGLSAIAERHGLGIGLFSDRGNLLSRQLGISFLPDDPGDGAIDRLTGLSLGELTQPAAVLIGQDGRIEYLDVSPDWLDRTETETILDAADRLHRSQAAA